MPIDTRNALMHRVQVYCFVLLELNLFLDTHPTDLRALEYFQKYKVLKDAAVAQYIANYGPIVATDVTSETNWNWIDNPWPWENGGIDNVGL